MLNGDELNAEIARRSLVTFAERTLSDWRPARHLEYIANILEDVEAGKNSRVIISLPVRHGKSLLCSSAFSAWFLGRNPRSHVLLVSHSEGLAQHHSRIAKQIIENEQYPFAATLSDDQTAAGRFSLREGGSMRALGTGSNISGYGADLLVLDDPLNDGASTSEKRNLWAWFTETAMSRVNPGGKVVIVTARLSVDDLPGRILESDGADAWTYIALPAVAGPSDPLGRAPGEPLWERIPLTELNSRRVALGEAAFAAQFQQAPSDEGEAPLFSFSDWKTFTRLPHFERNAYDTAEDVVRRHHTSVLDLARPDSSDLQNVTAVDPARTGNTTERSAHSFHAIVTLCVNVVDGMMYITAIEKFREREFWNARTRVLLHLATQNPVITLIEAVEGTGGALAGDLAASTPYNVAPVRVKDSKRERLARVVADIRSGRLRIRENLLKDVDPTRPENADVLDALSLAHDGATRLLQARRAGTYYAGGPAFELFAR